MPLGESIKLGAALTAVIRWELETRFWILSGQRSWCQEVAAASAAGSQCDGVELHISEMSKLFKVTRQTRRQTLKANWFFKMRKLKKREEEQLEEEDCSHLCVLHSCFLCDGRIFNPLV